MRNKIIENFERGLITSLESQSIPSGSSSDSLNWITRGDKIELTRGYSVTGDETYATTKVTGVHQAYDVNGVETLFKKVGRKLYYYETTTDDWTEVGTDLFPEAATTDEAYFDNYASLAGNCMYFSSENSSIYQIMISNPDDYIDMVAESTRGCISVKYNRLFVWNLPNDKTSLRLSWVDASNYTTIADENVGTGDGTEKTFTDTLSFKAGATKAHCFAIEVTDTSETFKDNYDGTLTGDAGGVGTINYTTGAISVTFQVAPTNTQAITCDYQWEDPTDEGLADFSYEATRVAGTGLVIRQDAGGGDLMTIDIFNDYIYCFHKTKTWVVDLPAVDTGYTSVEFRERVGTASNRSSVPVGNGIYYIDDNDIEKPAIKFLTLDMVTGTAIPIVVSNNLDLTSYDFTATAGFKWGDYIGFSCKSSNSSVNDTIIIYDELYKAFSLHRKYANNYTIYNGYLIGGDSLSNGALNLFNGFTDGGNSIIQNQWTGNTSKLNLNQLKKVKRLMFEGYISSTQKINVYLQIDRGGFNEIGTIEGSGSYVDESNAVTLGSSAIGSEVVGGGSDLPGGYEAYYFQTEMRLSTDKFQDIQIKFIATDIGYCAISYYKFYDIRPKTYKLPNKYRE